MKRIALIVYDDVQSLDIMGPVEVFVGANHALKRRGSSPAYQVHTFAAEGADIRLSNGLTLRTEGPLSQLRVGADTLLVAGGEGSRTIMKNQLFLAQLQRLAAGSRRVSSVCTGSYCLAAAGLLDGYHAVTHWAWLDQFTKSFPKVHIQPDRLFVSDRGRWTSAGVTAGIDMALGMIEEDLGGSLALEVARHLVVYLKRPGGQSQFSQLLAVQEAAHSGVRKVQGMLLSKPQEVQSVEELAKLAGMSPRHFSRTFKKEVGQAPAQYLIQAKIERAKFLLIDTRQSISEVAFGSGLGSDETLRRLFLRHLGITPSAFRARFS